MREAETGQGKVDLSVRLSPRWSPIAGLLLFAVVLGWIALMIVRGAPREGAGAILALVSLAALMLVAVAHSIKMRRRDVIDVMVASFKVRGVTVDRARVVSVKRHTDLFFKGVRIELTEGEWIGIPVHLHHPRRVLDAFRRCGYPVA